MSQKEFNNISSKELSADIRNKLQTAKTALEFLKANKSIPKEYIDRAVEDLEKVVKLLI